MTGRRNRAQAPSRFIPPRPSPPVALLWIKKWDTEDFKPKRVAAKFSANIIWLPVYLFAIIFCLREQPGFRGVVGAAPYKVSGKFLPAGHRKRCGVNAAASTLRRRADPYKVA